MAESHRTFLSKQGQIFGLSSETTSRGRLPGLVGIKFEDLNWKSDFFVLPLYINPRAVPNLCASHQTGAYFRMSRPFRQGLWDTLCLPLGSVMLVTTEHLASGLSYPSATSQACTHSPPALSPCLPAFPIFPLILDHWAFPLSQSHLAPEVESSSPLIPTACLHCKCSLASQIPRQWSLVLTSGS